MTLLWCCRYFEIIHKFLSVSRPLTPMRDTNKRKKILEAAVRIFARNGFYQSKVSEIAREAEVADGTIYLYFHNKDDILINLFEEEMTTHHPGNARPSSPGKTIRSG